MLLATTLLALSGVALANTEMLNLAFPLDSLPLNSNSQFQLSQSVIPPDIINDRH